MNSIILLVEDSPTQAHIYRAGLIAAKFTVVEAKDVATALSLLDQVAIDLVLTDYHLSERMTGLNLISAIRAQPALQSLPILLHSHAMNQELISKALATGATAAFQKDMTIARLVQRLKTALKRQPA